MNQDFKNAIFEAKKAIRLVHEGKIKRTFLKKEGPRAYTTELEDFNE